MRLIFENPKFRLLMLGSILNDVGGIMHLTVHGYLALTVTNSPFWTGAAAGMGGLGLISFGAFGGVLADRVDRRRLIICCLLLETTLMLTLAALIFTEQIRLWQILAASLLGGAVVGVKLPCRMALTLDVAGRGNLLSAMAANFAATNVIGIFIPLLGGQVGSRFHIGWAYIIMGIAFASSAVVIYNLRGVAGAGERRNSPWHDLKSGVRFAFTTPVVRTLILTSLVAELFGWAHEPMLPVMARDVMGVGLGGLGYLMSAASAGAFISMLTVSNVGDFKHKGWLLVGGLAGYGVFLMLFAASPWSPVAAFPLALVLLALAYASAMAAEAAMGTLIQTIVPDEMRGRVLSFQVMTWGVTGLSGFHTGAIATLLGAPLAIAIGGGVLALNALRLARRVSRLQPVEQKSRASE